MPNVYVWPSSSPTWVTTASTTYNTIVWQSATSTATTIINPIYFYTPHPAYNRAIQDLYAQHQMQRLNEANMAYQNQLNQQWQEQQARRDYAATEAARVIEPHREAAAARARDLLLQNLSEEQRRTFIANKWFVVKGGRSGLSYRIRDKGDLVANVEALDSRGNVVARLCAHGRSDLHLPIADHFLTQKIMLECAEDDFLRVANRH